MSERYCANTVSFRCSEGCLRRMSEQYCANTVSFRCSEGCLIPTVATRRDVTIVRRARVRLRGELSSGHSLAQPLDYFELFFIASSAACTPLSMRAFTASESDSSFFQVSTAFFRSLPEAGKPCASFFAVVNAS